MIVLDRVTKRYLYTTALKDVSLRISEPAIVFLKGPNGSGKTTLLKIICGIVKPSSGTCAVWGLNPRKDMKRILKTISFYFEDDPLPWWSSGKEYLEFISFMNDVPLEEIEGLMRDLGVTSYWDKKIFTYSSGMKRKIQVLKAFIGKHKIVILDEPLTLLDEESKKVLIEFFKEFGQHRILMISSHIDEGLTDIADMIVEMRNGEVINIIHSS